MFAVWGWGVGINGTSSVVAVSSIFSEYMDFFYFCTCSPLKRKKNLRLYVLFGEISGGAAEPRCWELAGYRQRGTWAEASGSPGCADQLASFLRLLSKPVPVS